MKNIKIIGESLFNLPWEKKPDNCNSVVWRDSRNPIIGRNPINNSGRVYNSAVITFNNEFIGIFRVDHKTGRPHLHLGKSSDGINWNINNEKIEWKDENGKIVNPGYAYDPRVVKIENDYYITWCTEFYGPTIGVGITKDFRTFRRLENAFLPFNRNGVLFPKKINGNYMMLNRPSDNGHTPFGDIFISESPDMCYWGKHKHVMSVSQVSWWQSLKIGAGPIPIETSEGWLIIYHGVINTCNGYVYSMGAAILDLNNPKKVLYRTKDYILTPETEYETVGFVPNVVFPCAALCDSATGKIAIYYGAADTYVAVAYTKIDELIDFIKKSSE